MLLASGLNASALGVDEVRDQHKSRKYTKLDAIVETATRLLFLPAFLAKWLLELPDRVVLHEPDHYGRCRWQEPYAESTESGASKHVPLSPEYKNPLHTCSSDGFAEHAADGKIILQRFKASWMDSVMLTWQGILYYGMQHFLRFFAVDHLLFMFQKDIHSAIAYLSGATYETSSGRRVQLSPLAAMTTDRAFATPGYSAAAFPTCNRVVPSISVPDNHFLCQCARLVYEDTAIVQDVVKHRWRMFFHGQQSVPAHRSRHCWVPDVCWFACSNDCALVLTLKGADPLWQLCLAADPPTSKSPRPGLGEVHRGLWQGLHQTDPFCPGRTMYDTLVAQLRTAHATGKAIYLTGHSLGGSLAAVFAGILLQREPELAACVQGIVTFAATRVGDAAFARRIGAGYSERCLRFVYGADMVPMLPPKGLGFKHIGQLCHLLSRPMHGSRLLMTDEDSRPVRREDRWGYLFSLRKIVSSHSQGENVLRLLLRILMLPVPGFSDHLPSCYEKVLRDELLLQQPPRARAHAELQA